MIKIEEPQTGDEARAASPPFFGPGEDSAYFPSMNRGKESVAVNLKTPQGRDLCLRLAGQADVLIENFRPGVARPPGAGLRSLRAPTRAWCTAPSPPTARKGPGPASPATT